TVARIPGPAPAVAASPALVVPLTLGESRSPAAAPPIVVPAAVPAIEPHVRLDPADRFDRYAIEIRAADNAVIWESRDLHASIERGELVVVAHVPATALRDGDYEMAVRGLTERGALADLGFVTLRLRRAR